MKKAGRKPQKLTDKMERFCQEYIIDLDGTKSAIRAGYSKRSASHIAFQLLKKPLVVERIKALKQAQFKRIEVTADRVIEQLGTVAFSDLRSVFDGTRLMAPNEWSDEAAALVAGLEVSTVSRGEGEVEYVAKIRSADRLKALELLGRHFKLFTDKVENTGKDGGPIETESRTTLDVSNLTNDQLRALASIPIHEE